MKARFFEALRALQLAPGAQGLEPDVRYHLTQALGLMMAVISEGQYAAEWLYGLEDNLPFELLAQAQGGAVVELPFDRGTVQTPIARVMVGMATILGHWANYEGYPAEEGGGEQYVPYRPDPDKGVIST